METIIDTAFGIIFVVVIIAGFLYFYRDWVFDMVADFRHSWNKRFGKAKQNGPSREH